MCLSMYSILHAIIYLLHSNDHLCNDIYGCHAMGEESAKKAHVDLSTCQPVNLNLRP